MATKRKLTHGAFADLVEQCRATARELHNAADLWDMVRPPPAVEDAAQALNRLNEATVRLERILLAHIANNAERRRLRAELTGKGDDT